MKTKLITSALAILMAFPLFAQDKTTVRATSSDISDNLDLRAVATIFGDSKDLEDFEYRLNDPNTQISNLDLNNDNYVDYLRVIESVEGNAHIVVIQAVLDRDLYQDIATVEVERDRNNNVVVQVVGDVYMYGDNYIYEPIYVNRPVIYASFWAPYYRPYCSSWYWGYYPSYFSYWAPYPVFRYRNAVAVHINFGISFHYASYRHCAVAYNSYYGRRANGYERRYPNRSFSNRNQGYANRYELDRNRDTRTRVAGTRELTNTRNSSTRTNARGNSQATLDSRSTTRGTTTRNNNVTSRTNTTTRNNNTVTPSRVTTPSRSTSNNRSFTQNKSTTTSRPSATRSNSTTRNNSSVRNTSSQNTQRSATMNNSRNSQRSSSVGSQRSSSTTKSSSSRSNNNSSARSSSSRGGRA